MKPTSPSVYVVALLALTPPLSNAALVWQSALDGDAAAIVGSDGVASGSPMATTDVNGNAGGAVLFNGSTDFFSVAPPVSILTAGSMSFWARVDNTGGQRGAIAVGASGGGATEYFTIQNTDGGNIGRWRTDLDDGDGDGGAGRVDVFSDVATTGVWQHIAVTFTAQDTLRMYVDGVLQSDTNSLATAEASYPITNGWLIGSERTTDRFFEGAIDDVRIYDSELTAGEVTTLFNDGPLFIPEPGVPLLLGLGACLFLGRTRRGRD